MPLNHLDPEVVKFYGARNRLVRELGYKDYEEYLSSPLWRWIRRKVFARDKVCRGCGKKPTQVHHGRYKKNGLLGTSIKHLYAVCRECHKRCEFSDDGEKLSPIAATKKLNPTASRREQFLARRRERHANFQVNRPDIDHAQRARDMARLDEIAKMKRPRRKRRRSRQERQRAAAEKA